MLTKSQKQEAVQLRNNTGRSLHDCFALTIKLNEIGEKVCENEIKVASIKTLAMIKDPELVPFLETKHFLFAFYIFSLLRKNGERFGQRFLDQLEGFTSLEDALKDLREEDSKSHSKISAGLKRLVGEDKKLCSVDLNVLESYFLLESGIFP